VALSDSYKYEQLQAAFLWGLFTKHYHVFGVDSACPTIMNEQ